MHTGIEAVGFDGYFEIPGFSRYAISMSTDVINKVTGTLVGGSTNPDGYNNVRLAGDDGHTLTWGRHRLMGYVFKHPGVCIKNLVVNHENGIKSDNSYSNLEWTTHQGNIEHAGANGLTTKCIRISVRDVDSGSVTHYPSIIKCARAHNLTKDCVNWRVYAGEKKVFPDRKQYRFYDPDKPWYIPSESELVVKTNHLSKQISLRYVLTNVVMVFQSYGELAKHLGISPATVTLWLKQPNQPVLPGYIQLKKDSDSSNWRQVRDPYRELDHYGSTVSVQVVNESTGMSRIFPSAKLCAGSMGILPTTLNERLKSGGSKVYSDGCRYSYYSKNSTVPQT
jgi:hypothetical protein